MKTLEEELGFYEETKGKLLAVHRGQFALVKGAELIGTFSTLERAYSEAVKRFGNVAVLIREILPADPAHKIPAFTQGLLHARP
jgi:hypothetical protein